MSMIKLGGLWKHKAKSGSSYYGGMKISEESAAEIVSFLAHNQECRFVLFKNDKRGNDRAPDLNLCLTGPDKESKPNEINPDEDVAF